MLHLSATLLFLGAGTASLALIAAMLIDNSTAITRALGVTGAQALPLAHVSARVRVVRAPRLAPMKVSLRAAA